MHRCAGIPHQQHCIQRAKFRICTDVQTRPLSRDWSRSSPRSLRSKNAHAELLPLFLSPFDRACCSPASSHVLRTLSTRRPRSFFRTAAAEISAASHPRLSSICRCRRLPLAVKPPRRASALVRASPQTTGHTATAAYVHTQLFKNSRQ